MSQTLSRKFHKLEFELRIFFSFGIVVIVLALSFLIFSRTPANSSLFGRYLGLSAGTSLTLGYVFAAFLALVASLLRMWAGSILTSRRMMSFRIQDDILLVEGPYLLVRNPIYLADLVAFCGFALCLPPVGLAMPVLLYLHYFQLIKYEESSLLRQFGGAYSSYRKETPCLIPSPKSLLRIPQAARDFKISYDGFRHNGLYLLFIPGFLGAAHFHNIFFALLVGIPSVIDWYIVHTKVGLQKNSQKKAATGRKQASLKGKKVFRDILYAQCWEDPQIDREALRISPQDVVFSITSGGCNVLTFLLDDPKKVISLDINPCQNYLLELKIAGLRELSHGDLLEFVGVRPSGRRIRLYKRLRPSLSPECREFWDLRVHKIAKGIIHSGRYEMYMRLLRGALVTLRRKKLFIRRLSCIENPRARRWLYQKEWENLSWWILTRIVLSRRLMTFLFDKTFFAHLEDNFSFGRHFAQKIRHALTELPFAESYFLTYMATGKYWDERHLPPYLKKENFEAIRARIDRIVIVTDSCEHFFSTLPDSSVTKFNFTNIFEWMPAAVYRRLLEQTIRVAEDGAVMTYRNLLVPREHPACLDEKIASLRGLAMSLHKKDLSFIYNAYIVEKIKKERSS